MKNINILILCLSTVLIIGCSIAPKNEDIAQSSSNVELNKDKHYSIIADNLVSALVQLDETNPLTTTVQMVQPSNMFGKHVLIAVEKQGYGIQIVSGDIGSSYLSYKHLSSQNETGFRNGYSISVGGISLERDYIEKDGQIKPSTPITIIGSESPYVELDDSIFGPLEDDSVTDYVSVTATVPQIVSLEETKNIPETQTIYKHNHANVYDTKFSNYRMLFDNYNDVEVQTLIFPNESLVLGKSNKQKIMQLAKRIDPETDIVSVIGCSHGRSEINNGNQVLAEGRAQRVKEAFLIAGANADLIMDEACWANVYWDEMVPRRGVMVTRKRVKSEG